MSFESPVLLRGSDLACRRGGRRVFAGVSLHLGAGEALWLRGPNGCGKTSLLRLLAGLSRPSEGRVDAPAGPPAYLGHANALKDELSVAEALRFLCSLHGPRPDDRQLAAALDAIGLGRRLAFPVRKLSQGQRRKLALARLGLGPARVWLLDEPYDALDQDGVAWLDERLQAHRAAGGAVVLTSHQAVALAGLHSLELGAGGTA